MVSVRRRLESLEARANKFRKGDEAVSREVLRRMTDEELEAYDEVLRRALEGGGFIEEDRPILEPAEELYREVRNERTTQTA